MYISERGLCSRMPPQHDITIVDYKKILVKESETLSPETRLSVELTELSIIGVDAIEKAKLFSKTTSKTKT
jgi:hypothetical protein